MLKAENDSQTLVLFRLGAQRYALHLGAVERVIQILPVVAISPGETDPGIGVVTNTLDSGAGALRDQVFMKVFSCCPLFGADNNSSSDQPILKISWAETSFPDH